MIDAPGISRRAFIITSAAVGGGLAIGINPMRGMAVDRAADGSPEITVWVVIRPDDTVVVRIARSEMGQGSLTGLAQMVAEELECDWSKVTWEYPTPGTSYARKKPWGGFATGGSASIRASQEYVRKGGAAARMMLVQAAANGGTCRLWNVLSTKASFRTRVRAARRPTARWLVPRRNSKCPRRRHSRTRRTGRSSANR